MDGYSISQVAELTGFPATTLRFYEQSGLVRPARTHSGYRRYDDSHLKLLSFVGRAKGFGLSLDEITELLGLLAGNECAPVQGRLRELVDAKIADAQARAVELEGFVADLQRVAASLDTHTPAGPCNDTCGCTAEEPDAIHRRVVIGARRGRRDAPAIACTLSAHEVDDRLARWDATVVDAAGCGVVDGGRRLTFGRDVDLTGLAALVAAEQDCCSFLTFTITVAADHVAVAVTGSAEVQPVIDSLMGVGS